jgi:hypothetical protein
VVVFTVAAAGVVFCIVQDRVTAAGVRRYVAVQRAAIAGERPAVSLDAVMAPARARALDQALVWSGTVAGAGLGAAAIAGWRRRRA